MLAVEFAGYLNEYLGVASFQDYPGAHNGLQVESDVPITRAAFAVDACQYTIDHAIARGANALVVHHGLFWGAAAPVTGTLYRRLSALVRADVALYSCHLPLDAHPEVGNNACLARLLGLTGVEPFGFVSGSAVGLQGDCISARDGLVQRLRETLGVELTVLACGPHSLRRVAIVSGGAGRLIGEAADAGVDLLLTGEGSHDTYFVAEERGVNLVYAGHYATESVGVRALQAHVEERLGLETLFIDHPTGL
jgi:dinuclear metal center YbgI/SA1388 family protein